MGPFDVFHFSDWMYPPQRGGIRATTIYDLVPLRFPEWVRPETRSMHTAKYRNAARTCDLIVCISRHTAERGGRAALRSRRNGSRSQPGRGRELLGRRSAGGGRAARIILSVSTLEPRKNPGRSSMPSPFSAGAGPTSRLVDRGGRGRRRGRGAPREGVELLGYVDNEELAGLYRGAAAFAYPSRFEGFGMPSWRRWRAGRRWSPARTHPSDEASGAAALRVDPDDADAFALTLERALDERDALVPAGIEHARGFTWEACGGPWQRRTGERFGAKVSLERPPGHEDEVPEARDAGRKLVGVHTRDDAATRLNRASHLRFRDPDHAHRVQAQPALQEIGRRPGRPQEP